MANKPENRTKTTFVSNIADVSLSHLLELMMALGSYWEGLVLVGGWVPYLLLKEYQNKEASFQHIGSKDIDIAVNPKIVDEKKYATILELLQSRGYKPKEGTTYSFVKTVTTNKGEEQIQIDFLGPEYGGTLPKKRHQRVQDDFLLRKARGADVVFDHAITITLEGKLPGGAEGKTTIKIADILGILTMKGIVMGSRHKEKDAYDISSLILYYKSGPLTVAGEIRPFKDNRLVNESIEAIHDKFRSREAEGPNWVADFQEAAGEVREQIKTQSYLQVQRFLTALYELPQPPKNPRNNSLVYIPEIQLHLYGSGAKRVIEGHVGKKGDKILILEIVEINGYKTQFEQQFTRLVFLNNLKFPGSLFTTEEPEIKVIVTYRTLDGKRYELFQSMTQEKRRGDGLFNVSLTGVPGIKQIDEK